MNQKEISLPRHNAIRNESVGVYFVNLLEGFNELDGFPLQLSFLHICWLSPRANIMASLVSSAFLIAL